MTKQVHLDQDDIDKILEEQTDVSVEEVPGETSMSADANDEDGVGWHVERVVIYVKKSTEPKGED